MKIVRHISLNGTDRDFRELEALGVVLPDMGNVPKGFMVFDLAESDERWPAVREWFLRRGERPGWEHTEFTKHEIAQAERLSMQSEWHHGYPQPESDFGYEQLTYDLTDWCEQCAVGKRQKAPFRFRGEPRWGRRSILQLNWVFDEFFVTPEVWETVFRPFGVGSRPVLNTRGAELTTAVQLVVDERVPMLAAPDLPTERCERCGRLRYLPIRRGPLRQLAQLPTGHMARTLDWFGSGHSAHNDILVSHDLWAAIVAANIRGAAFAPVNTEPWIDPGATYIDPPEDPERVKRFLAAVRGESPKKHGAVGKLRNAALTARTRLRRGHLAAKRDESGGSASATMPTASADVNESRLPVLWVDRWHSALSAAARIGLDPSAPNTIRLGPPATEEELRQVESVLGVPIPPDFRRLLGCARSASVFWQLSEDVKPPPPLQQIFGGDCSWSLDGPEGVVELYRGYRGWVEGGFSDPDDDYDSVWQGKFPFLHVRNGDLVAIDHDGRVVYLSHDDGEGHGYALGNNVNDFLDRWTAIGCPGPEDWQWLPFTDGPDSLINPCGPAARDWAAWFGLDAS